MSMKIRESNRFGALSEDRLATFESELGKTLPEEYRDFLLLHNGGVPERETFDVPGEDGGERPFHCFFALHDGPWDDSSAEGSQGFPLQVALADFRNDGGPKDVLPIGKDWSGSYVCINLADTGTGQILYYDHEMEQIVHLADSLSAFLAGFREVASWESDERAKVIAEP